MKKRKPFWYLSGGGLIIGLLLSVWGIFLTVKNDTNIVIVQWRVIWIVATVVLLTYFIMGLIIYNQKVLLDEKNEFFDGYHIEQCYDDKGTIILKIDYMSMLTIDSLVTIIFNDNGRELIIGVGVVENIKVNCYSSIKIIEKYDYAVWDSIVRNEKVALNKSYVLPSVGIEEAKLCAINL